MVADPVAVVDDVDVREHHALGESGGSRGVLHVHHVVGRNGFLAELVGVLGDFQRQRENFGQGVHAAVLFRAEEEHAPQVGQFLDLEHAALLAAQLGEHLVGGRHEVMVAHAFDDEQVFALGLLEQIAQFGIAVVGVHRDEDGPDPGRGEHQGQPVGDVGGPHGDLFALLHADGHEPLRHLVHARRKLGPCLPQIAVRMDHGVVVGKAGCRILQKLTERQLLHCKVVHVGTPGNQV